MSSANDSRRNRNNARRASCAITMPAAQALMPMGSSNCGEMPQQPQSHAQISQHRLSIASSALPIVSMPRSTGGSFSSGILAVPSLKRAASREKKCTRMKAIVSRIVLLTAIKFAFFGIFALVRFTPLVEGKVSVRVVDSFLLLTLKLVVAAATVGMTFVTRLVALRN
ncbi:hypothetical protein BCR44DRAFT_38175 [Catenaria anguillulae PL171]|uniref:Uncharacterized protein n=1 Tax=Catenaria anguillulae PL171 TaxID=765915 RepID=A0A1Y2HE33_9FUNG|nr:hypothetical protein BCR44DRAFT_38175 [Catenaria anguillulae PL171]